MKRPTLRRSLHAAVLAVATLATAAAMAAPAGGAETGLNVAGFFATPAQNAKLESLVSELQPGWVRVFLNWDQIEPAPGSYTTSQIAAYKAFFAALPAGTKVDVDVVGSPPWANGGSANIATPPVNDQSFAGFMNYLANAFGTSVTAYEIWNEPDDPSWWTGSATQYASLLKAAYSAVKAADPSAIVILGGLTANDSPYLQQLYSDSAGGSFDGVAVHTDDACSLTSPYAFAYNPGTDAINRWSFLGFSTVHSVMAANGDGAKPIYITEFGWSTTSTTCSSGASAGKRAGGVSDKTQALYLQQAYHCLAQPSYSYVAAAMWFDMVDFAPQNNIYDRYGLLSTSLQKRASFAAFAKEASGDPLTGACGNFAGPKLHLEAPTNGEHFGGRLMLRVTATVNGRAPGDKISQIALQDDGKTILNFNR
ncbi:MAG: cellulase family glycosylhydrolase, partial [Solirubrobacteraceae bacterium]